MSVDSYSRVTFTVILVVIASITYLVISLVDRASFILV